MVSLAIHQDQGINCGSADASTGGGGDCVVLL